MGPPLGGGPVCPFRRPAGAVLATPGPLWLSNTVRMREPEGICPSARMQQSGRTGHLTLDFEGSWCLVAGREPHRTLQNVLAKKSKLC